MSTQSGANGDPVPRPEGEGSSQTPPVGSQPPSQPPSQPAAGQPHSPPSQPAAGQPHPPQPPQPEYQGPPHYSTPPPGAQPHHTPPPHAPNHQPPRPAVTVPLGKMLYLCVAALGVINLFLGYVSTGDGDSMNLYKAAVAIYTLAPTMFFLAGLVAVREFLPRERAPGALPAMITTAIFVTLVLSAISSDGAGDLQTLFLVFGAIQFLLSWLAYLFDSGIFAARR